MERSHDSRSDPFSCFLETAFKEANQQKAGAVLIMQSPRLDGHRIRILKIAAKYRLPIVAMFANFTADGGLLSYGPDVEDLTRHTAIYMDKILKGANPGDLPIERRAKFALVLNMRTAKLLGVNIPRSVLARADEVIQ